MAAADGRNEVTFIMKLSKAFFCLVIPITFAALLLLLFWWFFIKPVYLELELIKMFEDNEHMPVSECPVYWTCLQEQKFGSLYFEKDVKDYLENYDYSKGSLVISWGRPLHSLSYRQVDYFKYATIGKPIFQSTYTPATLYIYQISKSNSDWRLRSEFDRTLIYPKIEIAQDDN